ncbi:hypothetical protein ACHAP6_001723 [Verticillium nonalfalfae]
MSNANNSPSGRFPGNGSNLDQMQRSGPRSTPIAAPSHERDFDEQIKGIHLPLVPDLHAKYLGLDEDDDYVEEAAQRDLKGQDDSDDDLQNGLRTMKLSEQKIVYNFDCEHSDDEDAM